MGTLVRDWLKVMHFTLIMGYPHLLETSKASSYRHLRVLLLVENQSIQNIRINLTEIFKTQSII